MGDPRNAEARPKAKQAQARARREQQERLQRALAELQKLPARKNGEKAQNEARVMQHSDGGLSLSYNAQISTDAAHGLLVGVAVTQEVNDWAQLMPAVRRIEERLEKKPQQMVADVGHTTRETIEDMAQRDIDFLGSLIKEEKLSRGDARDRLPPSVFIYDREQDCYVCPENKRLDYEGRHTKAGGFAYYRYEAEWRDCQSCAQKSQCCPENQKQGRLVTRVEESAVVLAFRQKMATDEARVQYRRQVAEFCHAWIKSQLGRRQFHVRGLLKVATEMLWACLTHNLQHWIGLDKLQREPMSA